MGKRFVKRKCPGCLEVKTFRSDNKTCGCRGSNPELHAGEVNQITDTQWDISTFTAKISTLEELVKEYKIDQRLWDVEKFVANRRELAKGGEVYQVKALLRKRVDVARAYQQIQELIEMAKGYAPKPPKVDRKVTPETGNLLVINLSDHHFGKLAWGYETGKQNYDVQIATTIFNRAFDTILQRASVYKFDEIWFVVGNDLLNSDDRQGRTTAGTVVSTDIRYTRTMTVVRNVLIACIEQLRHFAKKVKVKIVSGNHDEFSAWHTGSALECWFHNYTDVEIDNTPRYFKYDEFGKIMILWTHGDKGRRNDFPLLMATEQKEMWGRTKFREIHTGHYHQDRVEEQHGVKVRTLSSLGPSDRWHAENSYVGNLRQSEAFIYNRETGLIGTIVYVDPDDSLDVGNQGPIPFPAK